MCWLKIWTIEKPWALWPITGLTAVRAVRCAERLENLIVGHIFCFQYHFICSVKPWNGLIWIALYEVRGIIMQESTIEPHRGSIIHNKYFSSNSIPCSFSKLIYSSLKLTFWWCSFWFFTYSIKLSLAEIEYVNAPYPSCQPLKLGKMFSALIKSDEAIFISFIKYATATVGCIWVFANIFKIIWWLAHQNNI